MTMKRLASILLQISAVLTALGCTQELRIPFEPIDVQFVVPSSLNLKPGTTSVKFAVTGGHAPQPDDLIILSGPRGQYYCQITDISTDSFTIDLYENFANGEHSISIQRGLSTAFAGKSVITVEKYDDGVHPDAGSSVYGKVSCDGEPLAGVVVSDGIVVVKTDNNGIYQMKSAKKHGYVFVSVPSGYMVPADVVFPQTWATLSLAANTAERVDFELIEDTKDQTDFKLLVFGDLHLANRNNDISQFKYFLDDVDNYRKTYTRENIIGLTLGDMTWDRYWIDKSYSFPEYINEMKPLIGMQIFQTIGNHDHDIYQAGDFNTTKQYKKYLGPTYYSHNFGKVHFISLDNIECQNPGADMQANYANRIVPEQLEWLKEDLKHVSKDTPLIISMHANMHGNPNNTANVSNSTLNAADFKAALSGYKTVHLFTAHTHILYHVVDGNIYEHNVAAVCATWWWSGKANPGLSVCTDGAAGGYTIVDVKGKDIKYQYKAIQQDVSRQFYTFDRNSIALNVDTYVPNGNATNRALWNERVGRWKDDITDNDVHKNDVYIDVWNWERDWKVEVKEGNVSLPVEQVVDYSPLHLIAHTANRLNRDANANFLTGKTCVLHKVKANSATSTLTITVTDRFGNKYTENMKRPKDFTPATYKAY